MSTEVLVQIGDFYNIIYMMNVLFWEEIIIIKCGTQDHTTTNTYSKCSTKIDFTYDECMIEKMTLQTQGNISVISDWKTDLCG